MDKCRPSPLMMAFKKAYCVAMLRDMGAMSERLDRMRTGAVNFGDSKLTSAQGGIALHGPSGGPPIGAIGVADYAQRDTRISPVSAQVQWDCKRRKEQF